MQSQKPSPFQKATKKKSKLRAAIYGPSGSGKTFTALSIAKGHGGTIAVIDSERGASAKYSDRFEFDTVDLRKHYGGTTIADYTKAIQDAAGYSVLIIDSITHAWQELLEEVEQLAQTKFRGNTWSAWSQGTPKQREFVDAILAFDGHVLVTMRTKTEWSVEENNGKKNIKKIGLAPEQGKGIEYEFDVLLEITTDHIATVTKDRTGKFQDKVIKSPGAAFGSELFAWLDDGVEEQTNTEDMGKYQLFPLDEDIKRELKRRDVPEKARAAIMANLELWCVGTLDKGAKDGDTVGTRAQAALAFIETHPLIEA